MELTPYVGKYVGIRLCCGTTAYGRVGYGTNGWTLDESLLVIATPIDNEGLNVHSLNQYLVRLLLQPRAPPLRQYEIDPQAITLLLDITADIEKARPIYQPLLK
jgi:hypothetical protein